MTLVPEGMELSGLLAVILITVLAGYLHTVSGFGIGMIIIGGMGSVWGAFAGSMVLGIAQAVGFRIDPGFGVLAGHLVFLLILAVRPQGLFGRA